MKPVLERLRGAISYSEIQGIKVILEEIKTDEGILVASKIADKVGITRSVIVNGMKLLEVAGVVESRSLGMKGTHIKILDRETLNELIA